MEFQEGTTIADITDAERIICQTPTDDGPMETITGCKTFSQDGLIMVDFCPAEPGVRVAAIPDEAIVVCNDDYPDIGRIGVLVPTHSEAGTLLLQVLADRSAAEYEQASANPESGVFVFVKNGLPMQCSREGRTGITVARSHSVADARAGDEPGVTITQIGQTDFIRATREASSRGCEGIWTIQPDATWVWSAFPWAQQTKVPMPGAN